MARGDRSAKQLAKRIDLTYFKRLDPVRRWRVILIVVALVVTAAWLAQHVVTRSLRAYSSGPLASSHRLFSDQCGLCHVAEGGFRQPVTAAACEVCHAAPDHGGKQELTPRCGDCHREHEGVATMAETADRACTVCHAGELTTTSGVSDLRSVTSFVHDHPEFRALQPNSDLTQTLRFNHSVHMRPELRGPDGLVRMECTDCHRAAVSSKPWRFASASESASSRGASVASTGRGHETMSPISYEQNCAACHTLRFDARLVEEAPHRERAGVIREFLTGRYQELASHEAAITAEPVREPLRPDRPFAAEPLPATTRQAWIDRQIASAELVLYKKACKECHAVETGDDQLPKIVEPVLTSGWLKRARFDHTAHRMLSCEGCHPAGSSESADALLIPGVASCRQCHAGAGTAESRCFECHVYHDKSQEHTAPGKFMIPDLVHRAALP